MPETDYNIATKKGQTRKAKMTQAAKAQIARIDRLVKAGASLQVSCATCGVEGKEADDDTYVDMIYVVSIDEYFCSEKCKKKMPHDKRWDE